MRHPERERRRIQQLRRVRPEIAELLDFLEKITEMAPSLIPGSFDLGKLPRLQPGEPPLKPSAFPLDEARAQEAFRRLLEAFVEASGAQGPAAQLGLAVRGGMFNPRDACRAYLQEDATYFIDLENTGVAPAALVAQFAELAVKPQLIAAARAVGTVPTDASDRCPLCGSWPEILLVVDRKDAERIAVGVCRLCETEWPVRRVRCLACANEDPDRLSYLQVEGEPGARLNVCEDCRAYVPMVDTRGRLEVAPAVERAALAHLDVAGERSRYQFLGSPVFAGPQPGLSRSPARTA